MVSLGEKQLRGNENLHDIILVRCPAHLLHNVVKYLCEEHQSLANLSDIAKLAESLVEFSRLRVAMFPASLRFPCWADTRWCTLHKTLSRVLEVHRHDCPVFLLVSN
jgi:hypothetical protein